MPWDLPTSNESGSKLPVEAAFIGKLGRPLSFLGFRHFGHDINIVRVVFAMWTGGHKQDIAGALILKPFEPTSG